MGNCISQEYKNMFYNKSNDYVCPVFPTCENVQDKYYFEYLNNKEAGIVSNLETIMSISLKNISIPTDSFNQNTLFLGPGQYKYITGEYKGCQNCYYTYKISDEFKTSNIERIIFKLSFIYNFNRISKTFDIQIPENTLFKDIIQILNDNVKDIKIPVSISYIEESSCVQFLYEYKGHYFEVENFNYSVYNDSDDEPSGFIGEDNNYITFTLDEYIPPFKYPNGAFKGMVMLLNYPPDTKTFKMYNDEEFIYYKHVPTYITDYTKQENSDLYKKQKFDVNFGLYSVNGPKINYDDTKMPFINWDDGNTPDKDESNDGQVFLSWNNGDTDWDESTGEKTYYNFEETIRYINNNNLWDKTSHVYTNTGTDDNYLSCIIVFNPHRFPVQIKYLMFN